MMHYTCENCSHDTTHRLTYDRATGLLSCHDCNTASEEVQVADNDPPVATSFVLHGGRLVVVYNPHRHDPYRLYRNKDTVEIGYASSLHAIITLADQYNNAMGA